MSGLNLTMLLKLRSSLISFVNLNTYSFNDCLGQVNTDYKTNATLIDTYLWQNGIKIHLAKTKSIAPLRND